jgi:hypothetical protein
MDPSEQELPPLQTHIAQRMALEGIPVRAIARSLKQEATLVYETLEAAQGQGIIIDMPKDDWAPTANRADHAPSFKPGLRDDDLAFTCRQVFKLTPLQAAFMVALLKNSRVDKTKFHLLIENMRNRKPGTSPSDKDPTEPKMVDVVICHLRKRLKKVDQAIEIKTNWGDGYFIEPTCRSYVMKTYFPSPREQDDASADTA